MGLDISVLRMVSDKDEAKRLIKDHKYITIDKDDTWAERFKDRIIQIRERHWNFEKSLQNAGYNPDEYECIGGSCESVEFVKKSDIEKWNTGEYGTSLLITLPIKDMVKVRKRVNVIACDEIGYQRKGANARFYEDDMWDSPPVTTRKELLRHWRKYFCPMDKCRGSFKTNIVDKFIEGECIVRYW